MKKQFKKGQKGKVLNQILISVDAYECEGGVITADETYIDEGNFTVVKDHGDCLEVIFDDNPNLPSWKQVGRNFKGELINWSIGEDDFENIEVNGKRGKKVKIVEKGFKLCTNCGSVMSKVCMCSIKPLGKKLDPNSNKVEIKISLWSDEYGRNSGGEATLNLVPIDGEERFVITYRGDGDTYLREFYYLIEEKLGKGKYNIDDLENQEFANELSEMYSEDSRSEGIVEIKINPI